MFAKKLLAVSAAFALVVSPALAQQGYTLGPNSVYQGHILAAPSTPGTPPTGVGCTVAAGSTDSDGKCTASAASGSLTFTGQRPDGTTGYFTAPFCMITDASATSTVSMPVYTVSATAITLTTIISGHVLFWHCTGLNGG